jgi:hypothetical integral membrane protein (TIGR02206 family)
LCDSLRAERERDALRSSAEIINAQSPTVEQFSGEHIAALIVTAAAAGLALAPARHPDATWLVPLSRALAVLILAAYITEQAANALRGSWTLERSLPLQLTDAVTLLAVAALWSWPLLLVELTYFWGLTASLQAVLTPDLDQAFPSIFYFTYFTTHAGAVVAAVLLVFGLDMAPRRGAVGRVWVATAAFAALAGASDLLTGGNYMFLREKPERASLLDLMGPWPWYIAVAALLALVLYLLLDLPFRRVARSPAGGPALRRRSRPQ